MNTRRTIRSLIVAGLASSLVVACHAEHDTAQSEQGLTYSPDQRYIVKYKNATGKAALNRPDVQLARDLGQHDMQAVYMSDAVRDALARNPNIEYVEVDHRRAPMAESVPYGISMVQADQLGSGTDTIKVCIIDSGLRTHEDLPNSSATGDTSGVDECGHGTHVAGTVAATANNNAGVVGVAPDSVSLHIVTVFSGSDCAWTYSSDLVAAVDDCQANGADIISMSLGGSFSSNSENNAFANAYAAGVLSIAAAGNSGNTQKSYPASYDSVVSVAAVDSTKTVASFSQQNNQVELAAPGVGVLSTYLPGSHSVSGGGAAYFANQLEFAALGSVSGTLVDGGLCDSVGSWAGAVVLCERGSISFSDKYYNAQSGGAVGVAIYNNAAGNFSGTLGDNINRNIPGVSLSQEDGQTLLASVGTTGSVTSTDTGDGYAFLDGTSMATPHVSGVAALVWANNPTATNQDIRNALAVTAQDLGAAGRDNAYGYGLVQAKAASDYLAGGGTAPDCSSDGVCNADCAAGADPDCGPACFPVGDSCTSDAECCSNACRGRTGNKSCK